MSKRIPKSVEEKLEIANLYLEKGKSISSLIREYGVSDTAIRTWGRKYQQLDVAGLRESRNWIRYSKEVKATSEGIYFYNNERFQEKHNGLAPLELRNKAVA